MIKNEFFAGILKVNDENCRIQIQDPDPDLDLNPGPNPGPDPLVRGMDPWIQIADPDPPQNVMDPQHCLKDLQIRGLNTAA